jgi:hypothetical protein
LSVEFQITRLSQDGIPQVVGRLNKRHPASNQKADFVEHLWGAQAVGFFDFGEDWF